MSAELGVVAEGGRLELGEEGRQGRPLPLPYLQPGVVADVLQGDPVHGPDPQAGLDQVLAGRAEGAAETELGVADLLVLLEGDVALD